MTFYSGGNQGVDGFVAKEVSNHRAGEQRADDLRNGDKEMEECAVWFFISASLASGWIVSRPDVLRSNQSLDWLI